MKYGKIIKKYIDKITKNNLGITINSFIQYKILKQLIKKFIIINKHKYSNNDCCICMEELGDNYITLKCSHSYHIECIIKLLNYKNNCCLCRKDIPENLPIFNNEKLILQFISLIIFNIHNINNTHNYIKNYIKNLKNTTNCLHIFTNYKIKKLFKYLQEFDEINSTGIKKILKKFKKKINIDLGFILEMNKLVI